MSSSIDLPVEALREKTHHVLKCLEKKGVQGTLSVVYTSGFTLSYRCKKIDALEYDETQSFTLKVYLNHQTASVSITDLSIKSINAAVEKALSLVAYAQADKHAELPNASELAWTPVDLSLYHPWDISIQQLLFQMSACDELIHRYSSGKNLVNAEAIQCASHNSFIWRAQTLDNFQAYYPLSRHSISCQVLARQDDHMRIDYDFTAGRSSSSLMSMESVADAAVKRTMKRLNPLSAAPGHFPVIFEARAAKSLWYHLLSAIDGMAVYRKMSFLKDALGQLIFPEFIHVIQKPHIIEGLYSAPFDAEGVRTRGINYVKNGRLESYILTSYSARCLNLDTTGNAGGTYNVFVSHGDSTLTQLCREMSRGYLINELIGQGVNLVTGDYSRGAFGYWVDQGEIQYPVQEFTIAGNLKDMFENFLAVANDVTLFSQISTGSVWIEDMVISAS
jgi:PmbA protein